MIRAISPTAYARYFLTFPGRKKERLSFLKMKSIFNAANRLF